MKKVIDELGIITPPSEWDPRRWDLTDMVGRLLKVNAAPLFDLVVQVDDRNTSQYVLSITLPRQSGIMPQFHSPIPRHLLNQLNDLRPSPDISQRRRSKRQFLNLGDSPVDVTDELPDAAFLESLNNADPSVDISLQLPDANFLHSIQVFKYKLTVVLCLYCRLHTCSN